MLLHERQQGNASRVAGYVQQLPRTFDTPLHWSPAEQEALQYPHLVNEVPTPCASSAGVSRCGSSAVQLQERLASPCCVLKPCKGGLRCTV